MPRFASRASTLLPRSSPLSRTNQPPSPPPAPSFADASLPRTPGYHRFSRSSAVPTPTQPPLYRLQFFACRLTARHPIISTGQPTNAHQLLCLHQAETTEYPRERASEELPIGSSLKRDVSYVNRYNFANFAQTKAGESCENVRQLPCTPRGFSAVMQKKNWWYVNEPRRRHQFNLRLVSRRISPVQ